MEELSELLSVQFDPNKRGSFPKLLRAFKQVVNEEPSFSDVFPFLKKINDEVQRVTNINTKSKNITKVRKIVEAKYGANSDEVERTKKVVFMDKEELQKKFDNERRVRNEKLADLVDVEAKQIINVIKSTMRAEDWRDRYIFVALATGLRSIEILKLAAIKRHEDKKGWITVKNLAKTKKKREGTLERPLLFDAFPSVLRSLKKVRESIDNEGSNVEVSGRYNATINERIRHHFGRFTSHDLRRIYGAIASKTKKPKNMDEDLFLSKILGHEILASNSFLNYKTVRVVTNKKAKSNKKKKKKSRAGELVEVIKQRKKDGEPITRRALKELGYGSSTITRAIQMM